MSETTKTPNYGFIKPNVNADADLWGDHWNSNADNLDTIIHGIDTRPGGVTTWNTRTGAVTLTSGDVTTALTFTPYNSTNPANYQTAAQVTTSLGPYALLASPTFTGDPRSVTPAPGDSDTSIATTAFVAAAVSAASTAGVASWNTRTGAVTLSNADVVTVLPASSTTPVMDGTAAVGTGTTWARADHVHPVDTSRYAATNPSGYQTAAQVTTALAPYATLASPLLSGDPRSVTPPVGDNDFSIATTAFVTAAVAPVANNVGRNRIHNAGFSINQRGTVSGTALAVGIYGHDRWKAGAGGCTYTFTQAQPFTTITITAGTLQQVIEDRSVEGGNYMLSWTGTAQGRVGAGAYAASPVTVTGLTAGAAATVEFNAGTLGRVQMEPGAVATPPDFGSPQQQLAQCQRFYQQWFCTVVTSFSTIYPLSPLAVPMRATPTLTVQGITQGSGAAFTALLNGSIYQSTVNSLLGVANGFASADL